MLGRDRLSGVVIGAAIEVHRELGPGLLERTYRDCLAHELRCRGLACRTEVSLAVNYKGMSVGDAYRIDLLVERQLIVEVKAVEHILPVHRAQLLTYLRLSGLPIGLLLNFNVPVLKDGLLRLAGPCADAAPPTP